MSLTGWNTLIWIDDVRRRRQLTFFALPWLFSRISSSLNLLKFKVDARLTFSPSSLFFFFSFFPLLFSLSSLHFNNSTKRQTNKQKERKKNAKRSTSNSSIVHLSGHIRAKKFVHTTTTMKKKIQYLDRQPMTLRNNLIRTNSDDFYTKLERIRSSAAAAASSYSSRKYFVYYLWWRQVICLNKGWTWLDRYCLYMRNVNEPCISLPSSSSSLSFQNHRLYNSTHLIRLFIKNK